MTETFTITVGDLKALIDLEVAKALAWDATAKEAEDEARKASSPKQAKEQL